MIHVQSGKLFQRMVHVSKNLKDDLFDLRTVYFPGLNFTDPSSLSELSHNIACKINVNRLMLVNLLPSIRKQKNVIRVSQNQTQNMLQIL